MVPDRRLGGRGNSKSYIMLVNDQDEILVKIRQDLAVLLHLGLRGR